MMTQTIEPSELAKARARLYKLLAEVYMRPPDLEFLELLEEWVVLQIAAKDSFQLLSEQVRHGLTTLDNFFGGRMGSNGWNTLGKNVSLEKAVSVEFTKLFRGVSPRYSPPPPYESVYLEEGGRTFGELSTQLQREYRHFGLNSTNRLQGEPPDHLSFEFEFMHTLCNREAEVWDSGDEDEAHTLLLAEKQFLNTHLMNWLPKLCEKIREFERLGLFAGIADITEGWIVFDYTENLQGIG